MKTSASLIIAIFFSGFLLGQSSNNYSKQSLVVKVKQEFLPAQLNSESLTFGIELLDQLNQRNKINEIRVLNPGSKSDFYKIGFDEDVEILRTISEYKDLGYFEIVEPNFIGYAGGAAFSFTPNDDFYNRQWSLKNHGNFDLAPAQVGSDIEMEAAWEITQGSEEVVIAVLDSGIRFGHSEFSGRIWENTDETNTSSDADQNGYIGDYRGFDFTNIDNDPTDDHGHGTNVAGIIGATGNNGNGYAGVDWNSKIMPLKILNDSGKGFYATWIEAIFYAVDNGAHILNMSVGGSSFSAGMKSAFEHALSQGVTTIACMMNENNSVTYYPAGYEETIAIGSTDPDDKRSDEFPWDMTKGSNFGGHIDLCAPGNYIYGLSSSNGNNYNTYWSGTSQAAPHVSGVASLMLSMNPDLQPEEIRNILRESAEDQVGDNGEDTQGWDQYHGTGRLNALNALTLLPTSVHDITTSDFILNKNHISGGENIELFFSSTKQKQLLIVNSEGKLLQNKIFAGNNYLLEKTDFSPGMYFIKILEKGIRYNTQKIIVE